MSITVSQVQSLLTGTEQQQLTRVLHQLKLDVSDATVKNGILSLLYNPFAALFVAKKEDKIVGTVSVVSYPHLTAGVKSWLECLVVDEKYQGQGVGQQLVQAAIAYVRAKGITELHLTSNPSRVAAHRLYRKTGFEQYDTHHFRFKLSTLEK